MAKMQFASETMTLIAAKDAAVLCGVSLATWYRWDSAGRIPKAVRIGGTVRWRKADLFRWIENDCPDRKDFERLMQA